MTIGPLQLILIKLPDEQRTAPVSQELKAVRQKGIIRLIDFLYVTRDQDGNLRSKELSDLTDAEKADYGVVLKGLLGMRAAYTSGANVDQIAEALSLTQNDFGLSSAQVQRIADGVPAGGSAMLALFEHTWAVSLKEALLNAGGELVAQGLLDPKALAVGGTTLEDALASAQSIEAKAEQAAAAELADAEQKLSDADALAAAKIAEAERILAEAEAQAAAKIEEAEKIAAANIAASVRMASEEMRKASEQAEPSEPEAGETG